MTNIVVDTINGKMIVNTNDRYVGTALIEYGEFSSSEATIFKHFITEDMTVCDVGANFGAHTLLFSKLAKKVYAYEPQRGTFNALCGSLALNNITNVIPVCAAIGKIGQIVKYNDMNFSTFDNFGGFSFDGVMTGENLRTIMLETPCQFLKIDVEGMELDVLKGAEKMIKKYKPIMYIEADRPNKNNDLFAFIRKLGYVPYWHSAVFFNPHNFNKNQNNLFPGITSINVLCIPSTVRLTDLNLTDFTEAFAEDFGKYFNSPSFG